MTPTQRRLPSSQATPDSQVPPTGDADGHTRPHRVHPREHVVPQLVGVDARSLAAGRLTGFAALWAPAVTRLACRTGATASNLEAGIGAGLSAETRRAAPSAR